MDSEDEVTDSQIGYNVPYSSRAIGRLLKGKKRGGGSAINVNFSKGLFALISALTLYIGNA